MTKGREEHRFRGSGLCFAAVLFLITPYSPPGWSQVLQTAPVPTMPSADSSHGARRGLEPPDAASPLAGSNALRLEHLREDDRHKRLMADTARLLALTNELKAEVEKASKDELSLDVVRKAAEIEKLAHDVKERMKS